MRIVGLGQRFGGDDAVGIAVIERLRARGGLPGVEVMEASDATHLVAALETPGPVVVVDAVMGGGEPGRVRVLAPEDLASDGALAGVSSHGLDVRGAVELARVLYPGTAATRVFVVAVTIAEAPRFREGLSPAVAAAVDDAAGRALDLVRR